MSQLSAQEKSLDNGGVLIINTYYLLRLSLQVVHKKYKAGQVFPGKTWMNTLNKSWLSQKLKTRKGNGKREVRNSQ